MIFSLDRGAWKGVTVYTVGLAVLLIGVYLTVRALRREAEILI